ncbi:hypothetical protein [Planosporangium mesophilum]|uniref:Uncharacterized protein n=1 Tax=Planosporangium mesophilum TaxID=689768 RepID=A0A8J3TL37_9ACTN|nr:hypothetical protein [Planosporangium mesophilum]NJC84513.1 hypothetical protein [Planosporangium mesophilum]GII23340.1 hypothetical protein Pme01_29370 [Planosporangium mesophilum]
MTPTDPIRPGAALTDPNLREALAERLTRLEAAAATGGRKEKQSLEDARDTWSLLAAFPWQRLNYRYGRWQSAQTFWKAAITLGLWESYHWERTTESFQVLDPYTGARLGEFYPQSELKRRVGRPYTETDLLQMPGGTLEFAGDPASIGVYRLVGGDVDTISLSWCPWLNNVTLRKGIAMLRAGNADRLPPPYQFVDLDLLDKYRAWFADEPDKPQRKAPYASEVNPYRPGGYPRFGRPR